MKQSCLKSAIAAIGAFSLITFWACSSDEPAVPSTPASSEKSEIRSVEDACNLALAFLEAGNDIPASRSASAIDNVKVGYGVSSRSGAADTLFYSVNLSNNEGFVLVSAPVAAEPVLAYVENGSYDPAQITDNPGFNMFIEKSKEYISISSIEPGSPGGPVPVKKPYTLVKNAEPKLTTKWGQNFPEGKMFANGISGCVQTAMAQILSYFEQPTSLKLTYPGHDKYSIDLNWLDIKKHRTSFPNEFLYSSHLQNCEASEESHDALSYLCKELKYRNNTDSLSGSSAFSFQANLTYKTLLPNKTITPYSSFSEDCFNTLITYMISNKAVAHFRGEEWLDDKINAHAWVCEGGRHYEYHTEMYFANGEEDVRNTYYFYFNWGWNGALNGYFLGNVYDTTKGLQKDELPPYGVQLSSRADLSKLVYYFMIY